MIKTLPIEENPREKALKYGIESLTNVELLAIVLRTGNKNESVIALAHRLLNEIGSIGQLREVSYSTLTSLKGIKAAKAIELLATLEIGKRVSQSSLNSEFYNQPQSVFERLGEKMMSLKQEHFTVLILDNKNRLIKEKTLFIGSVNMSLVSTREVFKEALSVNGVSLICVHNHPSGDAMPSDEDQMMTKRLYESGEVMNVEVLDHIIIGWNQYYSFKADCLYKITLHN